MSIQKALYWTIFWISIAIIVNLGIYIEFGEQRAIEFFTGYLIEEFLSIDNLFVFLLIFNYFKIPVRYQRRVLNYGIAGVIILRGIFIFLGIALITRFHFILVVFGAILIYSGYKIALTKGKAVHPEKNKILRLIRRFMKTTNEIHGNHFFERKESKIYATPLFVCLLVIESTDLVFAVDSIPAIFAITTDPFVVFSSNILAVLGLRSIYFLLALIADKFEYVKKGVGFILTYVGIKMLLPFIFTGFHIPTFISLLIILTILAVSIVASIAIKKRNIRKKAV